MATTTAAERQVQVMPFEPALVLVHLIGLTDLLTDRIPEAVVSTLKGAVEPSKPPPDKQERSPEKEFQGAIYRDAEGRYCFPAAGIKKGLVTIARRFNKGTGTQVSAGIQMGCTLVEILGRQPERQTDVGRNKVGALVVTHRARYRAGWEMLVPTRYNAEIFTVEWVLRLYEQEGFGIGLGAWRPEKNGTYGQFAVKRAPAPANE